VDAREALHAAGVRLAAALGDGAPAPEAARSR
jgi:hypothetical protein